MNKRGISAVVATVLIILITIAAVAIIWALLLPTIKNNLGTNDLSADLSVSTSGGYTVWDSSTNTSCVQIKRGSDSANVTGMSIIFAFADGNSQSKNLNSSMVPALNQAKTFCFNMTGLGKPVSVSVAPIYYNANGQQVTGTPTSTGQLTSGSVSQGTPVSNDFQSSNTTCTPSKTCTDYPNQCSSALSNGCSNALDCSSSCGSGKSCNSTGWCVTTCNSICPDPSTVSCGQPISDGCGGLCSGNGTNINVCSQSSCQNVACTNNVCDYTNKSVSSSCNSSDVSHYLCDSNAICQHVTDSIGSGNLYSVYNSGSTMFDTFSTLNLSWGSKYIKFIGSSDSLSCIGSSNVCTTITSISIPPPNTWTSHNNIILASSSIIRAPMSGSTCGTYGKCCEGGDLFRVYNDLISCQLK